MILFVDYLLLLPNVLLGRKKNPDAGILLNYDDENDYSWGYTPIKEAFRALAKDDIVQPHRSYYNFRSSNVSTDDVGYNLYVFDRRYQQKITSSQPIKVKYKFDGVVPNDINGYTLVLTNKLVSTNSDGQRHFDSSYL